MNFADVSADHGPVVANFILPWVLLWRKLEEMIVDCEKNPVVIAPVVLDNQTVEVVKQY